MPVLCIVLSPDLSISVILRSIPQYKYYPIYIFSPTGPYRPVPSDKAKDGKEHDPHSTNGEARPGEDEPGDNDNQGDLNKTELTNIDEISIANDEKTDRCNDVQGMYAILTLTARGGGGGGGLEDKVCRTRKTTAHSAAPLHDCFL